jgi:phosphoribosylaminoimidazolecarboxamide formyltransferase/IMP cyclohydrolase
VAVNLYPFEAYRDRGLPLPELVEYIDIGGPTLLRAAAKNFNSVVTLADPADYAALIAELNENNGCSSLSTRRRLMGRAYATTARYDAAISDHLAAEAGAPTRTLRFGPAQPLRYGENPHQPAQVFPGLGPSPLDGVLGGKALSYNNLLDVEAALGAIAGQGPGVAVAVVKHGNPCGLALAPTAAEALELAWQGDPVSAFGSVISFSTPLEAADLAPLHLDDKSRRRFVEVLVAPAFSAEAVALCAHHKALRLVTARADEQSARPDHRIVMGLLLEQARDLAIADGYRHEAGPAQILDEALAAFALRAVRSVKSNAIVLARRLDADRLQLVGMGAGQPNRVTAAALALARAQENLGPGALGPVYAASDAFLPFRDTLDRLADAGVGLLLQPGGSIRDAEVAAAANERGVTLVLTGIRHFRH